LIDISLGGQTAPQLARLGTGGGFVTVDRGGLVLVHPVFEQESDLIAYLANKFPEALTPAQRRAYFIE
jgi:hypothetical protein